MHSDIGKLARNAERRLFSQKGMADILDPSDYHAAIGKALWEELLSKVSGNSPDMIKKMWRQLLPGNASVVPDAISILADLGGHLGPEAAAKVARSGPGSPRKAAFLCDLADMAGFPVHRSLRAMRSMADPKIFKIPCLVTKNDATLTVVADSWTDALTRMDQGFATVDATAVDVRDTYGFIENDSLGLTGEKAMREAGLGLMDVYIGALSQAHAAKSGIDPDGRESLAGYGWGVDMYDPSGNVYGCVYLLADNGAGRPVAGVAPDDTGTDVHVVAIAWTKDCPSGIRHHWKTGFKTAIRLLSPIGCCERRPGDVARTLSAAEIRGDIRRVSINRSLPGKLPPELSVARIQAPDEKSGDRPAWVDETAIKKLYGSEDSYGFDTMEEAMTFAKGEHLKAIGKVFEVPYVSCVGDDGIIRNLPGPALVMISPEYPDVMTEAIMGAAPGQECVGYWPCVLVNKRMLPPGLAERYRHAIDDTEVEREIMAETPVSVHFDRK